MISKIHVNQTYIVTTCIWIRLYFTEMFISFFNLKLLFYCSSTEYLLCVGLKISLAVHWDRNVQQNHPSHKISHIYNQNNSIGPINVIT